MTPKEKVTLFRNLHIKGKPFVLKNIWDTGSAKTIAECGDQALATSSWAVAAAYGYSDGEQCPFELVIANIERITSAVDLPVSLDIESGYSKTSEGIANTITQVIQAGAIGINIEDQFIGGDGLYSIEEQCSRIAVARKAASDAGLELFINARTDVYLKTKATDQNEKHLEEVIERGNAYANAGADGFFVPGLLDSSTIESLCQQVSLPINIMLMDKELKPEEFASLGVARISTGGLPYMIAMRSLVKA